MMQGSARHRKLPQTGQSGKTPSTNSYRIPAYIFHAIHMVHSSGVAKRNNPGV